MNNSHSAIRDYIKTRSNSVPRFILEQIVFLLLQPIPSVFGVAARALCFRPLLRARGMFAIEEDVVICHPQNLCLGRNAYIGRGSFLGASDGGIELGDNVCLMGQNYLNVFNYGAEERVGARIVLDHDVVMSVGCTIHGHSGVRLGAGTIVGPHTVFVSGNHGNLRSSEQHRFVPIDRKRPIEVGPNVWIGANVTVLPGVTIGPNTIVGANSMVGQSLPGDSICAGTPARVLRSSDVSPAASHLEGS